MKHVFTVVNFIIEKIFYYFSLLRFLFIKSPRCKRKTKDDIQLSPTFIRTTKRRKKPEWVIKEIIRLSALMHNHGCQKIADTFNRQHQEKRNMTVCKSTVHNYRQKHVYDIFQLRKKIKSQKPRNYSRNIIWSTDLTTITDQYKKQHAILGVIDNGTRACLLLDKVITKSTVTLLRHLLDAIEFYGKPKHIRMDNEPVFKSKLFRFSLWLLRIKPQYSEVACPWQNGRIERFFGTFKACIKKLIISENTLEQRFIEFRYFYNYVRTHNNLNGKTPGEAWNNQRHNRNGRNEYINLWKGVLTGFYFPPD